MQTEDAPTGEVVTGSAPAAPVPGPPRKSRGGGIGEWLLRRRTLRAVRAQLALTPALGRKLEHRARQAAELGRSALEPGEVREAGSADAVACELYRQAAFWALSALHVVGASRELNPHLPDAASGELARDFTTLLAQSDPGLLLEAAGGGVTLSELRKVLSEQNYADFCELTAEEQSRFALTLRAFVERLLIVLDAPRQHLALVQLQRWTRLGALFVCLVAFAGIGFFVAEFREQKRDLARDKTYRISSSAYPGCASPLQYCEQVPNYFFHTNDEENPWVEIDLGASARFSAVRVINRRDCCFERASPLWVEVSSDQKKFKKVAERAGKFSSWKVKFEPVSARWVRVRLNGRGILHLAAVRVLP